MKKNILFIATLLIGANTIAQPALDWAYSVGSDQNVGSSEIRRVHIGSNDELYTVVQFNGDHYRPDPANTMSVSIPDFGNTTAIVKYNTLGQYQSSIPLYFTASNGFQIDITGITSDASGNIYISGYCPQEFDANPGPGVNLITPFSVTSNYNMFVIKYSSTGSFLWSYQLEAISGDLAVGPNGNIFITGSGGPAFIDFDAGASVVNATSFGFNDAFLLEIDANGNYVDVTSFGGTGNERAINVDFDSNGNIYITGNYSKQTVGGYTQFDPLGSGAQYSPLTTNCADGFLLKLNSSKVFQWVNVFEGQEAFVISTLDIGSQRNLLINSQDEIIISFGCFGSVNADLINGTSTPTGEGSIIITSFDNTGTQLELARLREDNQYFSQNIALGTNDAIIFATIFMNSMDIDPGTNVQTLTNTGFGGAFAKFNSDLTIDWGYGFELGISPIVATNSTGEIHLSFTNYNSTALDVDLSANISQLYSATETCALIKYYECLPINESVINSSNVLTASQNGGTYQWVDCNNGNAPISGATSQSFTPTIGGDYACEITIGSCTYTSDCATSTAGIGDNYLENAINIYPNPSKGKVFITDDSNVNIDYIEVLDVFGRIIQTKTINNSKTELNLESGTYFLIFYSGNQKQSIQKVIITN